jgi:hypothetical protein
MAQALSTIDVSALVERTAACGRAFFELPEEERPAA